VRHRTGTLTGTSLFESPLGGFLVCKLKYKRVDTTPGAFKACAA
jgi:hypothetical protein